MEDYLAMIIDRVKDPSLQVSDLLFRRNQHQTTELLRTMVVRRAQEVHFCIGQAPFSLCVLVEEFAAFILAKHVMNMRT